MHIEKEKLDEFIKIANTIFKYPINEEDYESINLPFVTRLEVIDKDGRSYTNWDVEDKLSLSFQDGGLTLKIIIK